MMKDPKWTKITPAMAEKWLDKNNNSNRKLREGHAEAMADDMRHGRWTRCTTPIWFYEDGDIADGQHRLWAIVESGTTQNMLVGHGLDRKDGLNIDTNIVRTLVDNAAISGVDTGLSNQLISAARVIHCGPKMRQNNKAIGTSKAAVLEIVNLHREAATWAVSNAPKGKFVRNVVTVGALGRAWYHEEDKNRLKQFAEILTNGHGYSEKDAAAISLRNFLISHGQVTSGQFYEMSLKAQNAIHYFMRGKPLMVIKGVGGERYPLTAGGKMPRG